MSGADIGDVVTLGALDAPKEDAPHRIVINFPDDHGIGGMKVEIIDVTPEQVMLAVFHLTRSANQIADARQLKGAYEQAEIERIARELRKGH